MRWWIFWGCLSLTLTASAASPAGTAGGKLRSLLNEINTLQADFEQVQTGGVDREVHKTSGHFYLKRPGFFRWVYNGAHPQTIVADGKRVWLYDAELQQVSHKSQEQALAGTPALLLSSRDSLDKQFDLIEVGRVQATDYWVELLPLNQESQVKRIRIAFDEQTIHEMEMEDQFGQLTLIRLQNQRRNLPLADDLFRFTPPPGVDVMGEGP